MSQYVQKEVFENFAQLFPWVFLIVKKNQTKSAVCCELNQETMQKFPFTSDYHHVDFFLVDKDGCLLNKVSVLRPRSRLHALIPSIFRYSAETVFDCILRTSSECPDSEVCYILEIDKSGYLSSTIQVAVHVAKKNESIISQALKEKQNLDQIIAEEKRHQLKLFNN